MSSPETNSEFVDIAERRVGFVGKLAGMNRKELRQLVRQRGGRYCDQLDASLDLIVLGEEILAGGDEPTIEDGELAASVAKGETVVMTETEFWQSLGMVDAEEDACRLYTPTMLAELLNVPVATIRRWHRRGLIQPVRNVHKLPYFDFQEVASARKIADLFASGASVHEIEQKLKKLVQLFPNLQRPLSQLNVIVEGRNILLREGDGLVEPGGQKLFDFSTAPGSGEQNDASPELLTFEQAAEDVDISRLTTRADFMNLAIELEDNDEIEAACEVYRSYLLAFGPNADICFRLAENLYQFGDLTAARERYYAAIELDNELVEARASLGCVLVELDKPELAISAFKGALNYHADYPDVLYHLACQLDEIGQGEEAEPHWRNFLKLAPKSPWADEARDRLGLD